MSAHTDFPTAEVGGVPFEVTTLAGACAWLIERAVPQRIALNVRLANAYNVALASQDPKYRDLLVHDGINFPDGTPVVWFMRLRRGAARASRVRGPSLFPLVLRESVRHGTRHFLLGGTPQTLSQLEANIREAYPGVKIVGCYSPPFAPIDDAYVEDCAARVKSSSADLVWVGLGTPKQDQLGTALSLETGIVSVNVGAAFNFLAGSVREAPIWVQRTGLEWLYRLSSEPRRLWRRYLLGNIQFVVAATRDLVSRSDGM